VKQIGRLLVMIALAAAVPRPAAAQRNTLDIYFIDVEGGQATLVVTPAGQTLLIDTGFPGQGGFNALPGDPQKARDANRILAAARAAGVKQIDYLLITHFHADHDGGVPELAQLIPIRTFVDHDAPGPQADERVDADGPNSARSWLDFDRRAHEGRARDRLLHAPDLELLARR